MHKHTFTLDCGWPITVTCRSTSRRVAWNMARRRGFNVPNTNL